MKDQGQEQATEKMIQEKGLTAPRLTPKDVDDAIAGTTFTKLPSGKAMICEITLANGFTVRGESACVSPENFDQEIGERISLQNARDKIWGFLGYALQERFPVPPQPVAPPVDDGVPDYQKRMLAELKELNEKICKLKNFLDDPQQALPLPVEERTRMHEQFIVMCKYSMILAGRIDNF